MDFRRRTRVTEFVSSKERMKSFGVDLEGILRSSIMHHEVVVIEGFS
jgi:hypothetical protein